MSKKRVTLRAEGPKAAGKTLLLNWFAHKLREAGIKISTSPPTTAAQNILEVELSDGDRQMLAATGGKL